MSTGKTRLDPKGFILAAGLGTRLKPLTNHIPKPLVPFFGVPLLFLAMNKFVRAGITQLSVNSHHLGQKIKSALKNPPFSFSIYESYEPQILGTGGAYIPLKPWLGSTDLVVYNGDIVSDIDLGLLYRHHVSSSAPATMTVLPAHIPGTTPVYCKDGLVVGIGSHPPSIKNPSLHTFACAQVLSPEFLSFLPQSGPSEIKTAYEKAFSLKRPVSAFVHTGTIWHDLGTPLSLWRAHREYMDSYLANPKPNLQDPLEVMAINQKMGRFPKVFLDQVTEFQEFRIFGPSFLAGNLTGRGEIGPYFIGEGNIRLEGEIKISSSLLVGEDQTWKHLSIHNVILGHLEQIGF